MSNHVIKTLPHPFNENIGNVTKRQNPLTNSDIQINCARVRTCEFLGRKKGINLEEQIRLNFGYKKVIYGLGHSVSIKSYTVKGP